MQHILIRRSVLEAIRAAVNTAGRLEVGGILLGHRRGEHLDVISATMPGPKDVSATNSFERKDSSHQRKAMAAWLLSFRRTGWLGEWHSHPEPRPKPSTVDIQSWRKMARRTGSEMVFLIHGFTDQWVGVIGKNDALPMQARLIEESEIGRLYGEHRRP